jgi:nucleotide-binding universal stress UspA family protein
MRQFVMGSVAAKLVDHLTFAPLLIVGRAPVTPTYLVAVDGSTGAMRAVDFAAGVLGPTDCRIRLFHARRQSAMAAGGPSDVSPASVSVENAFDLARARFVAAGIGADRIDTHMVSGVSSRAAAIVKEAVESGCGTIVMGRRGMSAVRSFFIGRVSNKVIHLGRTHTVWLVT